MTGSGGKNHKPGTKFKFIKESSEGTSPKFEVEDEHGAKWKVKLGPEVKSETAATRLVWAVGYFVDDDYYRPQIHVQGLMPLSRGQEFVSGDTVTDVRLERHDQKGRFEDELELVREPFYRHPRAQRTQSDDGAHQRLGPEID